MKEITIFECFDGTRFDSKTEAVRYEEMGKILADAKSIYLAGTRLEDTTIQHSIKGVADYRKEICKRAAEYIPQFADRFLQCAEGTRHISHAERIISDYNVKIFNYAFFRLNCINPETGIEYEQPYYAIHPEEWTQFYEKYLKPEIEKSNSETK